jgi:hypothetical protein
MPFFVSVNMCALNNITDKQQCGQWEQAETVVQDMIDCSVEPDQYTYNSLINAYAKKVCDMTNCCFHCCYCCQHCSSYCLLLSLAAPTAAASIAADGTAIATVHT